MRLMTRPDEFRNDRVAHHVVRILGPGLTGHATAVTQGDTWGYYRWSAAGAVFKSSRLGGEICLAGREIHWNRNMLVDDQPFALGLAQNVRHADIDIDRIAVLPFAGDVRHVVHERHFAIT